MFILIVKQEKKVCSDYTTNELKNTSYTFNGNIFFQQLTRKELLYIHEMELELKAGSGNQLLWDQMSRNEDDSKGTKLYISIY